jgi:hypothetical protein
MKATTLRENEMLVRATIVTALAFAGASLVFVADASAKAKPYPQCMTDDGYGRKSPCSNLYKKEHPNWRGGDECMIDEGYGRVHSCSQQYKQSHSK